MTASSGSSSGSGPRSTRALLIDRTFGPWFWGNLSSNTGNWLFNVTAAIVVFRLSGSAFTVGLVSVAQFMPMVLLSPIAGAWSDRLDRRRQLLIGQLIAAASATYLAVTAVVLGMDGLPGAWPVLVAALGIGIGQAITQPALSSLVPFLVDDEDLEEGVALTSMTFHVGRALGPAGAGVMLATLGPPTAFVLNAVSFVPLLAAVAILRPRSEERREGSDRSLRAGFRYVRQHRDILLLLCGVGAAGFAADPAITLTPALADALGGGDTLVAVMVSGFGLTAGVASLMAGRIQRRYGQLRVAGAGGLILAASLLLAALAPTAVVAVAGFAGTGVGFVFAVTGFTSTLQRRVDDELRGRVMALWGVAFLGNRPIAAAIDGAAADVFGPRAAVGVAIIVSLGAFVLARRLRQDSPDPLARSDEGSQRS